MEKISRQHWSAERYAQAANFVPARGALVLELLAPRPGEHILDLGCGDGVLTEKIAAAGAVVVAVDAAPGMVAEAQRCGLDARVTAGQDLTAPSTRSSQTPRCIGCIPPCPGLPRIAAGWALCRRDGRS
jgi:2-polyprenyl-3-methyl-5-hydroxy-6-metoxy-1,4-benzoquinol methylase